ncbi:MAG TPA: hypothetical protein VGJ05_13735 [Fimbriiglobus sp.]|jgi:hypothetical protein
MVLLICFTAALVLTAPPPKPGASTGRISIWIDDKFEHFKPDGGDVTPISLPKEFVLLQEGFTIAPDRKNAIQLERSGSNRAAGITKSRLVVTPLTGDRKPFALEGYVVIGRIFSADGSKLYIIGGKGDQLDVEKVKTPDVYVLDLSSKKVKPILLPKKHRIEAASPDGKTFVLVYRPSTCAIRSEWL